MASIPSLSAITSGFPGGLHKAIFGDSRAELRKSITDHLVVCGADLVHLESNNKVPLEAANEESLSPEAIAQAAGSLLNQNSGPTKIELLLPPSEFLATSQIMPGVSTENLVSALELQRETLLPSYEQALSIAVVGSVNDSMEEQRITALWFSTEKLQTYFTAFHQEGLNLIAVQPRILSTEETAYSFSLIEEDAEQLTAITVEQGVITQWLQIETADLDQPEFAEQWQTATNSLADAKQIDARAADSYAVSPGESEADYRFYPYGALQAQQRVEKGRQLIAAVAVFAGLLLLSSIPFLFQSFELRMANARLESTQNMSADARADQSVVVNFENEWGAINDYPDQQLRQAMFRLQELLGNERLSSLELNEGLIRIQGTSSDPQAILQALEQDPMFTEVVFSRATNNTRYYIDLRLATVSFEAYMVRYFPDAS
ncbi:MAG: hypothetical protein MI746_03885 [Pseudomonadales bacterium]|nr:hypothetical protein [Pseudomonadales bacterium]